MVRIILGVIAGFIAWSILWIGSDQVLISTIDWYGKHQNEFARAMFNKDPGFEANSTILIMHLIRSVIFSLMSGYLTALIAGENRKSPMILGVLLFAFGIFVQVMAWNYLPIWYHILFLLLLIPMTMLGGRLKKI